MEPVEVIRARYRPERITTLFVSESAPASGAFFYYGDSAMSRHMQGCLGLPGDDFLTSFKALGWYLDDLVLTPVNHLTRRERKAKCRAAQDSLADRTAEHVEEAPTESRAITRGGLR